MVYRGILNAYSRFMKVHRGLQEGLERLYQMRTKPIPVTAVKMRQQYEAPKAMTAARTAMRMTPIPVSVGAFQTRRNQEGLKVMTVTKMAALRCPKRRQLRGWRPRGSHF